MTAVPVHIPFVGPRPLRGGEPLIGRTEDLQRLLDDLIARRVVVLHSAAGAGKSSLIHAGLISAMQKAGFDVWKPIVLNPDISDFADLPDNTNPYLLSAMVSLEDELPPRSRRSAAMLAQLDFGDYVASRPRRKKYANSNIVLIFDDLDDILNASTDAARREFFSVVGRTLAHDKYWALFTVRDELLAKLMLHQQVLPMRKFVHLDQLGHDAAVQVIEGLAAQGGRNFTHIDELLGMLSRVEGGLDGDHVDTTHTSEVDPLQLQTACRQLWIITPIGNSTIDARALELRANSNTHVLGGYYAHALRKLEYGLERAVREQISAKLIVKGRRARVRREQIGLENAVVERLLAYNLLDLEDYAGSEWLVLAHDRLIDAIEADNDDWDRTNPRMMTSPVIDRSTHASRRDRPAGIDTGVWQVRARVPSDEQSWVPAPRRAAPEVDEVPVLDPLATTLARSLIEVDEVRNRARLSVALINLAQIDAEWALVAQGVLDPSPIRSEWLERLCEQLPKLADPESYSEIPAHQHPGLSDLLIAMLELGDVLARARGPGKRRLLLAGFRASFQVAWFPTGMTRHLWDIVCRIEPPELGVLEGLVRNQAGETAVSRERDAFLLGRLCALELLDEVDGGQTLHISELAVSFLDYLQAGLCR